MRQYGEFRENPRKTHTGNLQLTYSFDRELILRELEQKANDEKDLGKSMHRKWAELARQANLQSMTGAQNINPAQVLNVHKY